MRTSRIVSLALGATVAFASTVAHAEDASPPRDSVWVRVLQKDALLVREAADGKRSTVVCTAPCNQWIPRRGQFKLVGAGIPNDTFELEPDDKRGVVLRVAEGSAGSIVGGVLLLVVGIPVTGIGVLLTAGGAECLADTHGCWFGSGLLILGVAVLAGGVGLDFAGGAALKSGSTRIVQDAVDPSSMARVPWFEQARPEGAIQRRTTMIPIVSLSF